MGAALNRVTLLGGCGKYGFAMKQTTNGAPVASGSITIAEPSKNGQWEVCVSSYGVQSVGTVTPQAQAVAQPTMQVVVDDEDIPF